MSDLSGLTIHSRRRAGARGRSSCTVGAGTYCTVWFFRVGNGRCMPTADINIGDFQAQATEGPKAYKRNQNMCSGIKKGKLINDLQREERECFNGIPPFATSI